MQPRLSAYSWLSCRKSEGAQWSKMDLLFSQTTEEMGISYLTCDFLTVYSVVVIVFYKGQMF